MKSEKSLSTNKRGPSRGIDLQKTMFETGLKGILSYYKLALRLEDIIKTIPYRLETERLNSIQEPSVWINFNKIRSDANHLVDIIKLLIVSFLRNRVKTLATNMTEDKSTLLKRMKIAKEYHQVNSVCNSIMISKNFFQLHINKLSYLNQEQREIPAVNVPQINQKEIPGLYKFSKELLFQEVYRKSQIIKFQYFVRKFIQKFVTSNRITRHQWTEEELCINEKPFMVLDFFISFYQFNAVLIDNEDWLNFQNKTSIVNAVEAPIKMNKKIFNQILQKILKLDFEEAEQQDQ